MIKGIVDEAKEVAVNAGLIIGATVVVATVISIIDEAMLYLARLI